MRLHDQAGTDEPANGRAMRVLGYVRGRPLFLFSNSHFLLFPFTPPFTSSYSSILLMFTYSISYLFCPLSFLSFTVMCHNCSSYIVTRLVRGLQPFLFWTPPY